MTIDFILNETMQSTQLDPTTPLSDYIRRYYSLNTKESCGVGNCGACSVIVYDPNNSKYTLANSCLLPLGTVIGKQVITIDGISKDGELGSVQQAYLDFAAPQCGFCTPGFVIAGTYFLLKMNGENFDDEAAREALSGNLCRCNGYGPYVKALMSLQGTVPNLTIPTDSVPACLYSDKNWYAPITIRDALSYLKRTPDAVIYSGGTDIMPKCRDLMTKHILYIGNISELLAEKITIDGDYIYISSSTTFEEIICSSLLNCLIPQMPEMSRKVGSPQVRSVATLIGNICNASPIGDSLPLLYALEAEIEICSLSNDYSIEKRYLSISDFITGPNETSIKEGELVTKVRFKKPKEGDKFYFQALKTRNAQSMTIASVSAKAHYEPNSHTLTSLRLFAGGVGPTVINLDDIVDLTLQKTPKKLIEHVTEAYDSVSLQPVSDLRGTSEYKREMIIQLILRIMSEIVN
ncbi:MAG: FAD binding domain-containing protein [archaeon]